MSGAGGDRYSLPIAQVQNGREVWVQRVNVANIDA
jgi:hypothetical protein